MTLTYPELVAIGAALTAYGKFPHLTEAIDRELIQVRECLPVDRHESIRETESECDKMGDTKTACRVVEHSTGLTPQTERPERGLAPMMPPTLDPRYDPKPGE